MREESDVRRASLWPSWAGAGNGDSSPSFQVAVLPQFPLKQGHGRCAPRRLWSPRELRSGLAVGNVFSFPLPPHCSTRKLGLPGHFPGSTRVAQIPLGEGKEGHLENWKDVFRSQINPLNSGKNWTD